MIPRLEAQRVLLFDAGGQRMGVFVAEITRLEVEDDDGLSPVPFAHRALAGLLDAGDLGVLPVFDLMGVVDPSRRPADRQQGSTVAIFSTEKGPVGLRMVRQGTAIEYQYSADTDSQTEGLSQVPAALRSLIMGVGELPDGAFFFFSPEAFVLTLDQHAPAGG